MKKLFYIAMLFFLIACEKETSIEKNSGNSVISKGTLQDNAGNCNKIKIFGLYRSDSVLNASNYISVLVNINTTGKYFIGSDTINGYWFADSGYVFSSGLQQINIKGFGKPILPLDANFTIKYSSSQCNFFIKDASYFGQGGTKNDYLPTTGGSNYTYLNKKTNDTIYTEIAKNSKTILGNTYRVFASINVAKGILDTMLYSKDGLGNYYCFDTIGNTPKAHYLCLSDNSTAGNIWETLPANCIFQSIATQVKYKFTITQQNIAVAINNLNFNNVIVVKRETQYLVNGIFETNNTWEFYYAKNIGLVAVNQVNAFYNLELPITRWSVY
jgi:hypothetical protein